MGYEGLGFIRLRDLFKYGLKLLNPKTLNLNPKPKPYTDKPFWSLAALG